MSDCDDQDPAVSPDAMEGCDGNDNDCDGVVDEDIESTVWYADHDWDGFGVPGTGVARAGCTWPQGRAPNTLDCDDGTGWVAPDQAEGTGNTFDDDCDGWGHAWRNTTLDWQVTAAAGRLVPLGDVTSDGLPDWVQGDQVHSVQGDYLLPRIDGILSGDVTGDGVVDLVLWKDGQAWLHAGPIDADVGVGEPLGQAEEVVLADVDGDGVDEVALLYDHTLRLSNGAVIVGVDDVAVLRGRRDVLVVEEAGFIYLFEDLDPFWWSTEEGYVGADRLHGAGGVCRR